MEVIFAIILVICILFIYFLPSIIAVKTNKDSTAGIVIINLFLGWTFIGWIVALVWSLTGKVSTEKYCPNCDAEISESDKFCPECGALFEHKKICPHCKTLNNKHASFCVECGKSIHKKKISEQTHTKDNS